MNPVTNTPDAVLAEAAEPVDALDALLRQIVGGYFVLTDGQGAVSKWSEPAELLFAQPFEDILGQGFFETLITGALPPTGEAWRRFLDAGDPPQVPGTVQLTGLRSDGERFPLEAVFVPVKLDEGFDFSLFLEDLSFELPMNLMLLRMRQQHPVVVRALRQALEPQVQPWEGWRTAGTLVVFRPLSATPWVEAELARREAERAASDAETEERLTNLDPGIQGGVADLDDAAAVVARLLSALERIDELERVAGGLPAQLDEARREADQRAAASDRDAATLRADLQRALAAVPSELDRHEQTAKIERQQTALAAAEASTARLSARLDQLEHDRIQAAQLADARLAEAVAAAEARAVDAMAESSRRFEAARAGLEARVGEVDITDQLEQVRAEHEEAAQAARVELATTLERLEREREREREAARSELASALERVEQVQRGTDALREQLSSVTVERATAQGLAGDDRRRLEELQRDADALRARVEAMGELAGEVAALREAVAGNDVREALDAHYLATAAQVAELRDAVGRSESTSAEVSALRDALARHESTAAEVAALREAVGRQEAAAAQLAELRDTVARGESSSVEVAGLREAVTRHEAATIEIGALREAVARFEATSTEVAALRDAVARHEAATTEMAALRDAVARHEATSNEIAALREAVARHDAAATEIAALHEAVGRHEAATTEVAALRRAVSEQQAASGIVEQQLAELRAQVSQAEVAAGHAPAQADVERQVQTMVGDTQRQIAALHARLAVLADTGREVAALKLRLDATAELASSEEVAELRASLDHLARDADLAALRDRVDDLPGRDELAALAAKDDVATLRERLEDLAGRDDVAALREQIDGLAVRDHLAALAGRDELTALREQLDGLAARDDLSGLAGRDELAAVITRMEGLAGRDELTVLREQLAGLAGRHEVVAIHERIEELVTRGLAGRDEVEALRERIDGLPHQGDEIARQALTAAEEALEKIAAVDRGAGTVLADVRALREAVETGRTDSTELRELVARLGGELEVAHGQADRAEAEALGAHEAAAAAGEAAGAAREDAAKAREEGAATRLEVEGQRERAILLGEQVAGVREAATAARADAAAARAATEGLDERLTTVDQRAAALRTEVGAGRERLNAVGAQVERLGAAAVESGETAVALRTELGQVREVAEATARGLDALRAEIGGVREAAEASRLGDVRIEAMQAELTFALKSLDELKQGLSSAGQAAVIARREAQQATRAAQNVGDGSTERVTEVFQQILGLAANRNAQPGRRPAPALAEAPKPPVPVREPRHGFDDAPAPMAILDLDGKFKELNPAFTKLVGYKEHEFMKAAWPSPHDRRDYKDQLEQLRQMGAGELRELSVQSTYMHGQGLMVPVVGKLTVALGEDGLPLHLVLEAEDRHTG